MDKIPYSFAKGAHTKLISSPSLVDRSSADASVKVSPTSPTPPYVTQLISPNEASILSYSDDGFFRYHDKSTLGVQSSVRWEKGGDCTALLSYRNGYMAAGRNGIVAHWDSRTNNEIASLAALSRAPYLSLAHNEQLVAAGTELKGTDACIDIWDLRYANKPFVTYIETHSDDVTWLQFHPSVPYVLLSASSDSLAAVSDVRKSDEDDSVLGVINTGASIARLGWGGSSRIRPKMVLEKDTMSNVPNLPNLGAFWSASDMQTIGIWEADGWEEVYSPSDVREVETSMIPEWKTEFIIDVITDNRLTRSMDNIDLFCGNQDGSAALIEISPDQNWTMQCRLRGGHSEIIRSVHWDLDNSCLFTGAEDGTICGWQLSGSNQLIQEEVTMSSVNDAQHRLPRPLKDERSRATYKPY